MGLNETPSANRLQIGIVGRRNAGKSTLLNALTGQDLAVVSDVPGTTTDPVSKSMEFLPLGPVTLIDTAGFDDEGTLGEKRTKKTREIFGKLDMAIFVTTEPEVLQEDEKQVFNFLLEKKIPVILVHNKIDMLNGEFPTPTDCEIWMSAEQGLNMETLKEMIITNAQCIKTPPPLIGDLITPGDIILLVIPVDTGAPKGRLILPQQQIIRDALDHHAGALSVQVEELSRVLEQFGKAIRMVITDSQVFGEVAKIVPKEIPLTSFSILFARYKGVLADAVRGVTGISTLQNHSKVLICEGCTHHRQCEDIGTVKIPQWIREFTGVEPAFSFVSGGEFPEDVSDYEMVIHCGGCMLTERVVQNRIEKAWSQGVPATNYGILIAYLKGILPRTITVFPEISKLLTK